MLRLHDAALAHVSVGFALVAWASSAHAHEVGLSRGLYTVADEHIDMELVLARPEVMSALPGLDANDNGVLDAPELDAASQMLTAQIVERINVQTAQSACTSQFLGASLTEEDGLAVRAGFACPDGSPLTVRVLLVNGLAAGHRHLAHVVSATSESDHIVTAVAPSFPLGDHEHVMSRWAWIGIGVEHILFGTDHLVFLIGLLLVGGRLRSLVAIITAFTAAHSITLALAVLGILSPSPALVEPLIALSVAYVGIENLRLRDASGRWRITAPFGLIHGFGFAGALSEIGMPKDDVPVTLVLFNVGVEVGQLTVMAIVVPVLLLLRRRGVLNDVRTRALSIAIVALGLFWLGSRLIASVGNP